MNKIAIFFLATMMVGLAILACSGKTELATTNENCVKTELVAFESISPDMFEIHDTTVTYYQNAVKKLYQHSQAKNRTEFNIACRGFKLMAKVEDDMITLTSSSYEDNSYLWFNGKGVMKPETVDLFYEVSTPINERPI